MFFPLHRTSANGVCAGKIYIAKPLIMPVLFGEKKLLLLCLSAGVGEEHPISAENDRQQRNLLIMNQLLSHLT